MENIDFSKIVSEEDIQHSINDNLKGMIVFLRAFSSFIYLVYISSVIFNIIPQNVKTTFSKSLFS